MDNLKNKNNDSSSNFLNSLMASAGNDDKTNDVMKTYMDIMFPGKYKTDDYSKENVKNIKQYKSLIIYLDKEGLIPWKNYDNVTVSNLDDINNSKKSSDDFQNSSRYYNFSKPIKFDGCIINGIGKCVINGTDSYIIDLSSCDELKPTGDEFTMGYSVGLNVERLDNGILKRTYDELLKFLKK